MFWKFPPAKTTIPANILNERLLSNVITADEYLSYLDASEAHKIPPEIQKIINKKGDAATKALKRRLYLESPTTASWSLFNARNTGAHVTNTIESLTGWAGLVVTPAFAWLAARLLVDPAWPLVGQMGAYALCLLAALLAMSLLVMKAVRRITEHDDYPKADDTSKNHNAAARASIADGLRAMDFKDLFYLTLDQDGFSVHPIFRGIATRITLRAVPIYLGVMILQNYLA